MARREIFVDDVDGKEDETVQPRRFSVGHQAYTIDLHDKNYEKFLKALEPWLEHAEKQSAPPLSPRAIRPARGAAKANDKGYTAADVRAWAAEEGIELAARGRIHKEIVEKFEYAKGLDKK